VVKSLPHNPSKFSFSQGGEVLSLVLSRSDLLLGSSLSLLLVSALETERGFCSRDLNYISLTLFAPTLYDRRLG
jgi:hypothetical protein